MKYKINDILAYNHQGAFSIGIVTKITILGEDQVIYSVNATEDMYADILEENVIKVLGNAKNIKEEYESSNE